MVPGGLVGFLALSCLLLGCQEKINQLQEVIKEKRCSYAINSAGLNAQRSPSPKAHGFLPSSSTHLYSEVIEPREVESRTTANDKDSISYIIKMEEDYKIVHLRRIFFIAAHMPVYTYNAKGDLIADYPYIQDDCYYSGSVDGALDSQVVLSTCTGLWGHVQIGSVRYGIEPVENSPTFQHRIYRKRPDLRQPCRGGGEGTDDGANATGKVGDVGTVGGHSPPTSKGGADRSKDAASARYLEYYLVVDQSTFVAHKRNETLLVLTILHMMADVHAIYLPIGLRVYLVGLELWTEKDRVTIDAKNLAATLDVFDKFASHELQRHVHLDHAGILTAKGHPSGLARGDSICHYNHASVSAMRTSLDPQNDAENAAHQLGHSLGFSHDDGSTNLARGCDCNCSKEGSCLMVGKSAPECPRLSNCSREVYDDMIRKPGKECLLDVPLKTFRNKVCGNEVTEEGEDCDCGLDEDMEGEGILSLFMKPDAKPLTQYEKQGESSIDGTFRGFRECRRNGCCQDNCKSKPDIDCLFGPCCKKCKFSEEGTVCREAVAECDLPEYCNGTSAECPADVYKQDGTPCSDSNRCFLGDCLDLHKHCVALFGKDAQEAPLSCFKEVNMRGDQSGNCGKDGEKYKKCDEEDVLCGRLQCVHNGRIPKMSTGQSIIQTPVENTLCWGTEFHLGLDASDLGAVKDGTTCGTGKICLNRSCVELDFMKYPCNFSKCNHRGVCNNNGNCHCSYGWAPPFCLGKGYGGSIESGPPSAYEQPLIRFIGFIILGALAAFILGLVAVCKRDPLKAWFAKAIRNNVLTEPYDTESMDNSTLKSQEGKLDLTSPT